MVKNSIKAITYTLFLLFLMLSFTVHAEESWIKKTKINYKATYASKYMWRGIDLQDDAPAFQSELFCDFGETGFYAGAFYSIAVNSRQRWREWDEIDVYFGYYNVVCPDKKYSLEYDIGFTHYYFPQQVRDVDTQDIALALKLPNIVPLGGSNLIPRLKIYYGWSPFSNEDSGLWVGIAAMYDFTIPPSILSRQNQKLSLKVETYHNDGAQSFEVNPGWSHIMTSIGTTFDWKGFQYTPEISYQWSLEDTVDKENELWFTITIGRDIR